MSRIFAFLKKYKKTSVITGAIVVLLIGKFVFGGEKKPIYETTIAQKKNILQEISVTGTVIPASAVDLAFERAGRVYRTYVRVGDHVKEGQLLALLTSADLAAQLRQSQASAASSQAIVSQYAYALAQQQAKLDELKRGARKEDVQIAEAKVSNAEKALHDAMQSVIETKQKAELDLAQVYEDIKGTLYDAYTDIDDAVHRLVVGVFSGEGTSNPRVTFVTRDLSMVALAEQQKISADSAVTALRTLVITLPTEESARATALVTAQTQVQTIRNFLTTVSSIINDAVGLTQATQDTYRSNIATARAKVNTALTALTNHEQRIATQKATNNANTTAAATALTNAQNNLTLAKKDLQLVKAGPTTEAVHAQEAAVAAARANLKSQQSLVASAWANVSGVQALLAGAAIRSPINGLVTKQDTKPGQSVPGLTPVISVISAENLEIEVFIPEIDVAKLLLGQEARVTLDSYGSDVLFPAKVIRIDPAETKIEGVATYRVRLQFASQDSRIRPGMTASVDIQTGSRTGVLAVPQRAVIRKDGKKFIRVLVQETIEDKTVEVGLAGSDGMVEIISGLNEGETVVLYIEV